MHRAGISPSAPRGIMLKVIIIFDSAIRKGMTLADPTFRGDSLKQVNV
jgi:hypothetical protein